MPARPDPELVVVWSGGQSLDVFEAPEDVIRWRAGQGTGVQSDGDTVLKKKQSWRTEARPLGGDRNTDEGPR